MVNPLAPVEPAPFDEISPVLAQEIAAGLTDIGDILERHSVTREEFLALAKTQAFRSMVAEAKSLWHADGNAKERIKAKALVAVEVNLPLLHRLANDEDLNPTARIEAVKELKALGGLNAKEEGAAAGGSGFNITITVGGEDVLAPKDVTPKQKVIDVAAE